MGKIKQPGSKWPTVLGLVALIAVIGVLDLATGYELSFFAFYFLPVGLAAWWLGGVESLVTAVGCAVVWFWADVATGHLYSSTFYAVWATLMRLGAFVIIGSLVSHIRRLVVAEQDEVAALQNKLLKLSDQKGSTGGLLLLICAQCKKIKDAQGVWQPLESYYSAESYVLFSVSACPECVRKTVEADGIRPSSTPPPSPNPVTG